MNPSVSLVKVFRLFKLEEMFFGIESVDTIGRHLIYWQRQRACDVLFNILVVPPSISAKIFLKNPYFKKKFNMLVFLHGSTSSNPNFLIYTYYQNQIPLHSFSLPTNSTYDLKAFRKHPRSGVNCFSFWCVCVRQRNLVSPK